MTEFNFKVRTGATKHPIWLLYRVRLQERVLC
jgi:hypothetical protein